MKNIASRFLAAALIVLALLSTRALAIDWTADMQQGKVVFKSLGPLAFGPEGILFAADTKAAAIVAIATGDTKPGASGELLKCKDVNQKVAALLGAAADQLLINDLAVNPISHKAYLAVSRGRGPDAIPVIVRIKTDGQPEVFELDK